MAEPDVRHELVPVNGGYKIQRVVADREFDPPIWVATKYLNEGRTFASRSEARDYMLSGVER